MTEICYVFIEIKKGGSLTKVCVMVDLRTLNDEHKENAILHKKKVGSYG
jgi:hypothetical protein